MQTGNLPESIFQLASRKVSATDFGLGPLHGIKYEDLLQY